MPAINKSALYDDWPSLPPLVRRAAGIHCLTSRSRLLRPFIMLV